MTSSAVDLIADRSATPHSATGLTYSSNQRRCIASSHPGELCTAPPPLVPNAGHRAFAPITDFLPVATPAQWAPSSPPFGPTSALIGCESAPFGARTRRRKNVEPQQRADHR